MPETKALAPRDLLILATLAEGPNHGYGLIKRVAARSNSGVQLDPANLYRVLRRMRHSQWIEEVAGQESPGERRRRTYDITARGREIFEAELERLAQLVEQASSGIR